jgi:hypothetical protein
VNIPDEIRAELERKVWTAADKLSWLGLPAVTRSQWYDNWTADPEIGGRLLRYMDNSGQVRLYLKDALLKRYARSRRAAPTEVLKCLGLSADQAILRQYIKPHGILLAGSRLILWGPARTWKVMLLTVFERAARESASPFAVVLTQSGAIADPTMRRIVEDAANKLGIVQTRWMSDPLGRLNT